MARGFARGCAVLPAQAAPARALEPVDVFGAPVAFDITNTSTLSYNVDNRDTRPNQVSTLANDDWGLFYNRINVLANGGAWQVGLRIDNAWFFRYPNATQIALDLTESRPATPGGAPAPVYFRQKLSEAGVELSNRYIDWLYPAKYYATYTSPARRARPGRRLRRSSGAASCSASASSTSSRATPRCAARASPRRTRGRSLAACHRGRRHPEPAAHRPRERALPRRRSERHARPDRRVGSWDAARGTQ